MDGTVWSRLNMSFCPVTMLLTKLFKYTGISAARLWDSYSIHSIFFSSRLKILEISQVEIRKHFSRVNVWEAFYVIQEISGDGVMENVLSPPTRIFARNAVTKLYFNLFSLLFRSFHLRFRYCYFNEVSRSGETVLKSFSTIVSVITGNETTFTFHFMLH